MGRILDLIVWVIVTLFSPDAGLNEIDEENERANNGKSNQQKGD